MKNFFIILFYFLSIRLGADECLKKIIFPFESTVLLPTYNYNIIWEYDENCQGRVKIDLLQEGNIILNISPNTENNGKFLWNVPKNLHSGIPNPYNYSIRIIDLTNQSNFIESSFFVISPSDYIYPLVIIPVSANSIGAYNTNWKTDLFFYNSFDLEDTIDIYLFFFKEGEAEGKPPIGYYFKMQKGEIKIIKDVVQNSFKTKGAGSIIVDEHYMHSIYWVIPSAAYLYNDKGDEGTYGSYIPALGDSADRYYFTNKLLLNLKENKDFRTNIGIASKANFPTRVKIFLYDDNTNLIGEKEITIPSYGFYQEYGIYRQFTSDEINGGFAYIKVLENNHKPFIYPFASVIDNKTGSLYFIPQF